MSATRTLHEPMPGRSIVDEAGRFLCGMAISPNRGDYAEGRYVAVLVAPRWNDDGTLRVDIVCHAFGLQAGWEGMPIFILPQGAEAKRLLPVCLSARGDATIPSLPPGEYRFAASAEWQRCSFERTPASPWRYDAWSNRSAVGLTLRQSVLRPGRLVLVANGYTDRAEWAGAEVHYCLADSAGPPNLLSSATLVLAEPVESESESETHREVPERASCGSAVAQIGRPGSLWRSAEVRQEDVYGLSGTAQVKHNLWLCAIAKSRQSDDQP